MPVEGTSAGRSTYIRTDNACRYRHDTKGGWSFAVANVLFRTSTSVYVCIHTYVALTRCLLVRVLRFAPQYGGTTTFNTHLYIYIVFFGGRGRGGDDVQNAMKKLAKSGGKKKEKKQWAQPSGGDKPKKEKKKAEVGVV